MIAQQDLVVRDEPKLSDLKISNSPPSTGTRPNASPSAPARVAEPPVHAQRRTRLQAVLVLPLWLAFAVGWWRVLRNWPASDLVRSFELLAVIAALYGLALALWIRHNLSIYRRKGPRLAVRTLTVDYSRDALGQPVRSAQPGMLDAQHITIETAAGEKLYRPSQAARDFQPSR
jgi:hypothetical protein